jgi:hypothetical protein
MGTHSIYQKMVVVHGLPCAATPLMLILIHTIFRSYSTDVNMPSCLYVASEECVQEGGGDQ